MPILGLMSTESVASQRWTNIRRRVFYEYPNGPSPLTGLLSMMKADETNDPEFSWWEKRLKEQVTLTENISTTIVYYKTWVSPSTWTLADGNITWTADSLYGIAVDDATYFRVGHVIQFKSFLADASGYATVKGIVTSVDTANTPDRIAFRCLATTAACDYDHGNNDDLEVQVIGSAFPQGVTDLSSEAYYLPINPGNYTQIFRTPFSFTGNALVTPVKFDDTGIYKDKAKQHSIDHMIEMELATLFGHKHKHVPSGTADQTTGVGLPRYTMGGILYFLALWEAGSTYENTAATADTDDNKRIITNSAGTISEDLYDTYLERLFRSTSNSANEKLVLCGSGFLKTIQAMYRGSSTAFYNPPLTDTFGMDVTAHRTAFGTVYYKAHPLFSRNAALRNNALFVDVHNLVYRNMAKRDTQLLKNRQPRDGDYRKDEWFSEFGLEIRFPESFMYLQNVTTFTP